MTTVLTPAQIGEVLDAVVSFDRFICNTRFSMRPEQWAEFIKHIEDHERTYKTDDPTSIPAPRTTCVECGVKLIPEFDANTNTSPSSYHCASCFAKCIEARD